MLKKSFNINSSDIEPKRVVLLGANGFIGSSCIANLNKIGIKNTPLSRQEIDLLSHNAHDQLRNFLIPSDTLIFVSAEAPVKNYQMLKNNIIICENVCKALESQRVNHLIYISSDAVYSDSMEPLNENSITQPESLHGIMHLSRELMLNSVAKDYLCVLRPTLIYGSLDPHNGYGPNSFMRKALENEDITLFGNGEELRDHIYISDVVEIIKQVILRDGKGILNLATGRLVNFYEIAKIAINITKSKSKILHKDRLGPMPHNGYRAFDTKRVDELFKTFEFTKLTQGLKEFLS